MSNDLADIKKRIFEEDKVERIFEAIGCEIIRYEQSGTLLTAKLPDKFNSNNTRAVQCRLNEGLWCSIRNRSDFKGDIYNLISYIKFDERDEGLQATIHEAKSFICDLFGWEYKSNNIVFKKDPLERIKAMRYKGSRIKSIKPNKVISESVLDDFVDIPIQSWVDEGIGIDTQIEYGIGLDLMTHRITIPVRNRFGQLVGVKGRMMLERDVTDYNPKYMYIYRCNQSLELFNLHIAIRAVKQHRELIIVEGEKSCMKFYQNGIYNVVAIGASDLSDYQRDIIYSLGRDINIVLAYDNDKTIEEVQSVAETLNKRHVQMIFDRENKLPPKSAPIDSGIETWNYLYNNNKYDIC